MDDDDAGMSWDQIVKLIFVIGSIIVLLILLFIAVVLPSLGQ